MLPLVLAQVDPVKTAADGLAANFWPYALALVGAALVFVVRQYVAAQTAHAKELSEVRTAHAAELAKRNEAHAAELAKLQAQLIEALRDASKEQRDLLLQIVPLTGKLTQGLEIVEQMSRE